MTEGQSKSSICPPDHVMPARPYHIHPAGDATRVSVMPRKVTVKIGDAENRCW